MNSLINGRTVVVAEPHDVQRVTDIYDGQIDIVATQDISTNTQGHVYVPKGSNFAQGASKRIELQ